MDRSAVDIDAHLPLKVFVPETAAATCCLVDDISVPRQENLLLELEVIEVPPVLIGETSVITYFPVFNSLKSVLVLLKLDC